MEIPEQPTLLTNYADYLRSSSESRWEIINGEPFLMSPAPSTKHQQVVGNLHLAFGNYLRGKGCSVFTAPFDVRLFAEGKSDEEITTVVQPDLSIICSPDKLDDRGCMGAPDLVVEVTSPSTYKRDKVDKLYLYRKAKVREYWIVDPEKETIEVFRFADDPDRFPDIKVYSLQDRDSLAVGVFTDLTIEMTDVFA